MSVHSTPPNSGQRLHHPVGFNEQTSYDPFFPSSPSEEQLVPVENDHSPYQQSYHSPSPSHTSRSHHSNPPKSASSASSYNQNHASSYAGPANQDPTSHLGVAQEAADGPYDFLSPNAYISDAGYSGASDHTTTPDFENGFYLEDNFGMLADPSQNVDLSDLPNAEVNHGERHPSDETEGTRGSVDTNITRASIGTGIATLDSHLMSPVLTESGDLQSRQGSGSPPEGMGQSKHESIGNMPPALLMHNVAQGHMEQAHSHQFGDHGQMQITPTETDSSRSTGPSPKMPSTATLPGTAPAASPVFRIENYSRGDSPSRGESLLPRSGAKRSRSGSRSSHHAVERGGTNEAEGGGDYFAEAPTSLIQDSDRVGLDPEARYGTGGQEIPNFKDQEQTEQIAMKNIDVAEWLDRSEPGSDNEVDVPPTKPTSVSIGKRQRARSAGTQSLSHENLGKFDHTVKDAHIPGPGVLIDEESGEEEEEDQDEVASLSDPSMEAPLSPKAVPVNETPGEGKPGVYNELPDQPALYRAKLWQDPLYDSSNPGVKMQPLTANEAMMRFEQRAESLDDMSRRGTWGSRRLSESDLQGLFHSMSFGEKNSIGGKDKRERSSLFQQAAAKLATRRSSIMKRQESQTGKQQQQPSAHQSLQEHSRKDSSGGRKESLAVPSSSPPSSLRRMSSLGKRPKSPKINTGSAAAAMAFQTGALGVGGSISATATTSPSGWPSLKRQRSKSDVNGLNYNQGHSSSLADLWTQQGGPPMPSLAAPPAAPLKKEDTYTTAGLADAEDEDEDEAMEDAGVTMDLSIRPDSIVPTLEGFKSNIRQLNPRLPPFMFDRIAQEQLRRFKKLLDFKIKHVQAVKMGKCASGKHCTELGGEPTYLPSKSSSREPEMSHAGFSVAGLGQSDEDVNALAEGIVTPAQFPPGVPMPPVKRLPAEFECSLCFKVKKFHKPSDWSKHVHEDVQPFTCTFATCAEPKSFKRKADWVRHENERHRQLEWWMCNMNDCSHKCYRKDNFVQHLVREHKLPEPKVKTTKVGKPAVRGPSAQKARTKQEHGDDSNDEVDQVWKLVEECRHETPKNPKDEACKFCGNVCNSWKKLTVHLAKHMEQISMPVLGVVKQREVTPETIISPIEQRLAAQSNMSPTVQNPWGAPSGHNSQSPFGMPIGGVHGNTPTPGGYSSISPGGFTPGGLTPGGNYFSQADQNMSNYQRVSPNTYPPAEQAQHLNTNYAPRPSPLNAMSSYGSHGSHSNSSYSVSPGPQFNPVNRGFSHPPTTSPENIYGGMPAPSVPTSQPRASPYDDNGGFQYVPQQQQTFQSPVEGVGYQFGSQTPSSYAQNAPTPSTYPGPQTSTPSYPQQTTPPTSYPQPHQMSPPSAGYRGHQTTPPTSYQQPSHMSPPPNPTYGQQHPSQMGVAGLGMQYQMGYSQAGVDASLYAQQQQQHHLQQGQQRQQGQGGFGYGQQ
ncbi:hypothetical protein P7C71_g2275, partial [Lecanoromycetidae sp. Uapishka_2]